MEGGSVQTVSLYLCCLNVVEYESTTAERKIRGVGEINERNDENLGRKIERNRENTQGQHLYNYSTLFSLIIFEDILLAVDGSYWCLMSFFSHTGVTRHNLGGKTGQLRRTDL